MRRFVALVAVIILVGAGAVCCRAAEADVGALIKEFCGTAEAVQRTPAELQAAYATVVDSLLPDMGSDDLGKRASAQNTLEDISLRAGGPGADVQREALAKAVAAKLSAAPNAVAKVWMLRQLQHVGRAECVPAVAAAMNDKEARVQECARRALQENPSDQASKALRDALAKASEAPWRVALVNAVAGRRDAAGVAGLAALLKNADESVALAAAAGLGRIGGAEAAQALAAIRKTAAGKLRLVVLDAYLACADQLVAKDKDAAFRIYKEIDDSSSPDRMRMGALRGMVMVLGEQAVPILTKVLTGKEPAMRAFALSLVSDIPGEAATKAFVAILPKLGLAEQAALITAFGGRGDPAAKPAVIKALKSEDEAVRSAAVTAMAALGDANDVGLLAQMAADADGKDRDAIFQTLFSLKGDKVDATMTAGLRKGDPKVRVQLIRALAARRAKDATGDLVKSVADADAEIRTEAAKALGVVGDTTALGPLTGLLKAQADAERDAAEKAVSAICLRTDDKEACAAPLLAAYAGAQGAAKASLLATLAKAGTAKALDAVRGALKVGDEAVKEAAIRALADWPTDAPSADLLTVAKTDPKATHQVLALRGYVRLTGLSAKPDAGKVAMYRQALEAAKRPEEKKMVLSALADSPSAATLAIAQSMMATADLKNEAAMATAKIARAVSGAYPAEAREAVDAVLAQAADENVKNQAQEVLNFLTRFEDYIVAWLASGRYEAKDKDGPGLFDVVFPPEEGDGSKARWKPAPPGTADQPWHFDLAATFGGGENCCGYLRTYIHSDKDRDAQLELGTDDGVKVWLNGKVVHANNATRGFGPAQDKVKISLKQGWNVLLMKVTQSGGGWEACARIRAPDGGKIKGVRTRVEPDGK